MVISLKPVLLFSGFPLIKEIFLLQGCHCWGITGRPGLCISENLSVLRCCLHELLVQPLPGSCSSWVLPELRFTPAEKLLVHVQALPSAEPGWRPTSTKPARGSCLSPPKMLVLTGDSRSRAGVAPGLTASAEW